MEFSVAETPVSNSFRSADVDSLEIEVVIKSREAKTPVLSSVTSADVDSLEIEVVIELREVETPVLSSATSAEVGSLEMIADRSWSACFVAVLLSDMAVALQALLTLVIKSLRILTRPDSISVRAELVGMVPVIEQLSSNFAVRPEST
jgi:hypothetical protein